MPADVVAHDEQDVRLRLEADELDAAIERAAVRRVVAGDGLGLALALRHQPPLSDAALHQRRRDGLGAGTRQGLVLCRLAGRVGAPGEPGRELLHHRGDVVEQRLRLRLDRRLAGLEVDAIEVVAALDVERLRHRLAAVLLLELLGRLRLARRGAGPSARCRRPGRPRRVDWNCRSECGQRYPSLHRSILAVSGAERHGRSPLSIAAASASSSTASCRYSSARADRAGPMTRTSPPPPGWRDSPRTTCGTPDRASTGGVSGRPRPAGCERAPRSRPPHSASARPAEPGDRAKGSLPLIARGRRGRAVDVARSPPAAGRYDLSCRRRGFRPPMAPARSCC